MDPKDKKPPVASAVVIRHSEFPDLILHGKRKDTNQWSIPGGHVHKDESLKDAAVRETKEETGLELNPDDLEHIGSEHYNTKEDKKLVVHLFVCKKPYHHESMDFTGDKDEEFKELKFINPLDHDDLYRPNGENIVVTYLKGELKKPEVKKAEKLASSEKIEKDELKNKHLKLVDPNKKEDTKFEDPWDQAKHEREQHDTEDPNTDYSEEGEELDKALAYSTDILAATPKTDVPQEGIRSDGSPFKRTINQTAKFGRAAKGGQLTATAAYRHYKHTPHHPVSLGLKYVIHRIENHDAYKNASPEQQNMLDDNFLKLHQQGKAAEKNGWVKKEHLRRFILDNPNLIKQVKTHRRKLHDAIRQNTPWAIKNINGEENVALTRGLDTIDPGQDHALASYADKSSTGFGSIMHHRWVPLKNIWYAYDSGPKAATSKEFGNENEFLVSPHKILNASEKDIQHLLPRQFHDYGNKQSIVKTIEHLQNNPNPETQKKAQAKLLESRDPIVHRSLAYFSKHPEIQAKLLESNDPEVHRKLAWNFNTHPEIQAKLLESNDPYVHRKLAWNFNTHPEIQAKLLEIRDPIVHRTLALHSTHPEIQAKLLESRDPIVHRYLAEKSTHPEIQSKLLESKDPEVHEYLAQHSTHPEIQAKLLESRDPIVHRSLAYFSKHPEIQAKLLESNDPEIYEILARHSTHPEIQQKAKEKLQQLQQQTNKSEFKNLEVYQFFHNVTDDLIKVEIKDKNNLQAAEATFKIELGDIIVPEEVKVNDKHKTSDLAKEMYNYVNEIINLTKQELEKMSQPALRFPNIKGLPTRPEEQVKLISRRKYFTPTEQSKSTKSQFFGPKQTSQEDLEFKKLANKVAFDLKQKGAIKPENVSEERKQIEGDIKESRKKSHATGFILGSPSSKVSQPYIYDQESERKQIEEGKITPEEAGRSYESTKEHEAAHHLLNSIQNHPEFSELHRNALVDKLIGFIGPENKKALEKYLIHKKYNPNDENFKEEMLNHARDFLVSEYNRKDLEENIKQGEPGKFLPVNYGSLKKEWQKITNYAKKMTPSQLHNIADDYRDRFKYVKKSENTIENLSKKKNSKVKNFRRFFLKRKIDHSGNSGTGIVAVGIQFPNKKCLINWMTDTPSFNFYDSLKDIKEVHGHNGDTEINFMDDLNKTEEMKKFENEIQKMNSRSRYTKKDSLRKLPFLFLNKRFMGKD